MHNKGGLEWMQPDCLLRLTVRRSSAATATVLLPFQGFLNLQAVAALVLQDLDRFLIPNDETVVGVLHDNVDLVKRQTVAPQRRNGETLEVLLVCGAEYQLLFILVHGQLTCKVRPSSSNDNNKESWQDSRFTALVHASLRRRYGRGWHTNTNFFVFLVDGPGMWRWGMGCFEFSTQTQLGGLAG